MFSKVKGRMAEDVFIEHSISIYLSIGMQRFFLCLCGLVGRMVGRAFDFKFGSVLIPSLLENIGFHSMIFLLAESQA